MVKRWALSRRKEGEDGVRIPGAEGAASLWLLPFSVREGEAICRDQGHAGGGHPVTERRSVGTLSLSNAGCGGNGNADPTVSQTIAGVSQTLLKIIECIKLSLFYG